MQSSAIHLLREAGEPDSQKKAAFTFPPLSHLVSFSTKPEKFSERQEPGLSGLCESEICWAGNRPSSWPTKQRSPGRAAIPGLGRGTSLDQSACQPQTQKRASQSEGRKQATPARHAVLFLSMEKNASSRSCPSFLQQGFPGRARSPLC